MKSPKNIHRDCLNFAPIDVAKGLCHLSKEIINADAEQCSNFAPIAKCKRCLHFTVEDGKVELGFCAASPHTPPFPAYPDMVAVTCSDYKEKN